MNERMETTAAEAPRRRRAYAWPVVVALVLAQIASVAHDSTHTLADVGESCAACIHLDPSGPVPVTAPGTVLAPLADDAAPSLSTACLPSARYFKYPARAPPLA